MDNKENRQNDGFGKGITLIIIGVVALLVTFFDFEIDWHVLAKLWPIVLIIIGVCVMPINKWIRLAIAAVVLAAGVIAYQQKADDTKVEKIEFRTRSHPRIIFNDDDDD